MPVPYQLQSEFSVIHHVYEGISREVFRSYFLNSQAEIRHLHDQTLL